MNELNIATMPLTQNEINSFFRDNDQMGLSDRTQAHLVTERIVTPGDLAELNNKEVWDQVVENCKRPPMIANPNNATVHGSVDNEMAMRLAHTSSQSRTDAL